MVKCMYCGEWEAKVEIPNPNMDEIEPVFWNVCLICDEVIKNQMSLSMGTIIASKKHGSEIGKRIVEKAIKRLNEIAYESDTPIMSIECAKSQSEVNE